MMNVVYCVTANYIDKIKPSIRSLRDHNPDVDIYVVTEADKIDIDDVTVIDIRGQNYFPEGSINYNNKFTYIGLLKVCYQSLLSVDKVIHLDADTVVVDSLKPMWDINLDGKWYALCDEYKQSFYRPFGEKYYNCGVMLINLKQLREDKIQDAMVEYLNTVEQPWCEQDAFNKFGIEQDKIVEMPIRFNESHLKIGCTDNPAIIHYCACKNWLNNEKTFRYEYIKKYKEELI